MLTAVAGASLSKTKNDRDAVKCFRLTSDNGGAMTSLASTCLKAVAMGGTVSQIYLVVEGHVLVVDVGISSVVSSTGHPIEHLVTIISSIFETRLETGTSVGVYADDDELGSPPGHTSEQVMGVAGVGSMSLQMDAAPTAAEMESVAVLMDMALSEVMLAS
jgi:hypothetical protein